MHTRKYYKSNLKSCYAFTLLKLITILINHCIKLRTGFRFLFMESIPFSHFNYQSKTLVSAPNGGNYFIVFRYYFT